MGLTKPRAAQIFNLDYKQSTRVVTTVSVPLSGGAPSSVDGVSLSTGDRVLVTAQSTGSQNGLYYVVTLGSGSNGTWARTSDGNENGEIEAGMIVMVTEGVIYADTQWKLITDDPITIGTTALTFTQNYMANSIAGGSSNVTVFSNANVVISSAGTANVLTVSSTGTVTTGTASVTGNITGGNIAASTANISTFIGNTFFGSVPAQPTYYNIAPLNLNNSLSSATKVQLNLINTGGGAGAGSAIDFYTYQISVAAANAESRIAAIDDGNYSAYLSLQTKTPGSTGTNGLVERVKVDSTGASVVANITGGNILTGGRVSATGNIQGGNLLTGGLISSTGNVTGGNVSATLVSGTTLSATANVTGGNIATGGIVSATGNVTAGNLVTTGQANVGTLTVNGGSTFTGNLLPSANVTYNLGSPTQRWKEIFLAANTIDIGGATISADIETGSLILKGPDGAEFILTGSSPTDSFGVFGIVEAGNTSSATSTTTGALRVAGGAGIGGNIYTGGIVDIAGNSIYLGNLVLKDNGSNIFGLYAADGTTPATISQTSVDTTKISNGTSNVQVVSVNANVTVSVGGTANVIVVSTAGANVLGTLGVTGNVTGGNVLTGGLISATGNITGGNISAVNHTGTNVSVTGTVTTASTVGGVITGSSASVSGTVTAASVVGGVITGSSASVTGNVNSSNVVASTSLTNGNITITGANIVSTGPTIYIDPNGSGGTDGNVIITGNLSVQGNVTYINSNNVTTNDLTINMANNAATAAAANGGGIGVGPAGSEYVSLTYNSTSNIWVATNGLSSQGILSATGNVTGSNLIAGAQVVATGNITGSNIITAGNVVGSTFIASGNIVVQSRQQVKFYDTDSSNFISLRAPNALTGDYLLTLPTSYGNADQVLSTNGAGILAWADQSGGGGGSSATSYPNSTVSPVPGSIGNFDLAFNFVQTSQEIPFESSATDAFGVNLGEVYSMMDPGGEVLEPVDLGVLI